MLAPAPPRHPDPPNLQLHLPRRNFIKKYSRDGQVPLTFLRKLQAMRARRRGFITPRRIIVFRCSALARLARLLTTHAASGPYSAYSATCPIRWGLLGQVRIKWPVHCCVSLHHFSPCHSRKANRARQVEGSSGVRPSIHRRAG